jgi:RNA polymerase sigma-70 factor (sigma-E family)
MTTAASVGPRRTRAWQRAPHAEAFSEVVSRHTDDLARFAYVVCGDRALAEDVVAEALTEAWPRWRRGRIDDLVPYVRRSIVNEVYSRGRRRRLERREAELHRPAGPDGRFEESVGDQQALWPLVARLPLQQRVVLVLRVIEDQSEAETAELLGVPAGTVKSRLSRALTALRTMVEEHDA